MGWCEKMICHLSELSEFGQKTMHLVSGNGHGHNCDRDRLKDFFCPFSWNFQIFFLSLSRHNIPHEYRNDNHQQADSRVLQDATRREGLALWLFCPRRATGGQRR